MEVQESRAAEKEQSTGVNDGKSFLRRTIALYEKRTGKSSELYLNARRIMPGGQSHNARFFEPYPFYASRARGKYIWDVDGNRYIDYWMGHTALIMGHSPPAVVRVIKSQSTNGLLFGSPNKFAYELASLVNKTVPCAESVRFCSTGAEATMYAIRLARSFTGKNTIMKMRGGWHGYNSSLSIGVTPPFDDPESKGLLREEERFVCLGEFNDIEATRRIINENANDLAAVILEPLVGAGGVIPAKREYLRFLREECDRLNFVLIFDEIITGFRLALGGAQEFYGINPDLCTLGKILGGGLPVSAVAGRGEIMSLADTTTKAKNERCWIGGGTFSENALCMRSGIATVKYLMKNKDTIYERIGKLGTDLRTSIDKVFSENGIRSRTTGLGSLFATHFLSEGQEELAGPKDVSATDRKTEHEYYFTLIAKHGIYFIPGHIGAISTAHTKLDTRQFVKASSIFAQNFSGRRKASA